MVAGVELYLKGWRPEGRRLVAISNSGATCVMAADAAEAEGLPLEPLCQETQAELRTILPSFASPVNPVDITAALLTNSRLFSDILPVIAKDPAADVFLVGVPVAGQGYDVDAFARDTAVFAEATGKPIVVAAPQPTVTGRFAAAGLPVFADEAEALALLARRGAPVVPHRLCRSEDEALSTFEDLGAGRPQGLLARDRAQVGAPASSA